MSKVSLSFSSISALQSGSLYGSYGNHVAPSLYSIEEPDEASLDPLVGGTANGKDIWTPEQIAAYLNRTGGGWGIGPNELLQQGGDTNVITFGFHDNQQSLFDNGYVYAKNGGLFGFSEYFNFAPFTEAQRDATREAIQYWDDLVSVSFVETDSYHADINFANLASAPSTQAYSRIPTSGYADNFDGFYGTTMSIAGLAGDVWVSASQASNFQLQPGGYGLNTLVHEIGHSLGLSHPGAYNFGPGFAVTYGNGAEYAQDARNYSIMSYWNPRDLGSTSTGVPTRDFNWSIMQIAYGATPMIHDILAIQAMYGADTTTRTGDTTYGFNSNAGRDAFDFTTNAWPTMTIYDAGGNDTLDASGYGVTQVIDLTPGSLSSIGGMTVEEAASLTLEQVNANRAELGLGPVSEATYNANMAAFYNNPEWLGRLTDNVGIAYETIIENAIGGSGDDTIIGNSANNILVGNAGDDIVNGGDGLDVVTLGDGDDIFEAEIGAAQEQMRKMSLPVDIITDFDASGDDLIDLSGLGSFHFNGTAANKNAGDVTYKVYDSITGAENALGFDIDGQAGVNDASGPVTIVYGNVDGDAADFAIILMNTGSVDASDFLFA